MTPMVLVDRLMFRSPYVLANVQGDNVVQFAL